MSQGQLQKVEYQAGFKIFREGDKGNNAFLIEKGAVQLTKMVDGEEVVLATLGPGDVVGEMALIEDKPRSATAKVISRASLYIVSGNAFGEHMERSSPLVRKMMSLLSDRLRVETQRNFQKK